MASFSLKLRLALDPPEQRESEPMEATREYGDSERRCCTALRRSDGLRMELETRRLAAVAGAGVAASGNGYGEAGIAEGGATEPE